MGGRSSINQKLTQSLDLLELGLDHLRRGHCPAADSERGRKSLEPIAIARVILTETKSKEEGTLSPFFTPPAFKAPCRLMQPTIEPNRKVSWRKKCSLQSSCPSTAMQNTMAYLKLRENHLSSDDGRAL